MHLVFFDDPVIRNQLKPITLTRPIAKIRLGHNLLEEKWLKIAKINNRPFYLTESYLASKYLKPNEQSDFIYINSSIIASEEIWKQIIDLKEGQYLSHEGQALAIRTKKILDFSFAIKDFEEVGFHKEICRIKSLPDLFLFNDQEILEDFIRNSNGENSHPILDPYTRVYNNQNIFLEENVSIKSAIINAENGPVYIAKNAIIQEGAILIGPVSIGENSMVAYGAKIRGGTTIGPNCRVGGEVGKSIFFANTNKAHDGFIGNSVIGEWCNLGANTNNSNLKNNYKPVDLYDYQTSKLKNSGEIFVGSFIGDYSRIGISTMLNTGTVIGVSSNVFGAGFQSKFIPSFSWGGKTEGYEKYDFRKAIETLNFSMKRREIELSKIDEKILEYISLNTKKE